jgi:trk system potassium uptake protein TrkH
MFVGGAAGSTAGGIKLNTLALIVLTNVAIMKGRTQIHIFGKEIPTQQGQFAIVLALISVCLILLSTSALLMLEDGLEFDRVFFDTVSAFSSVGFTTGIAESVSETGRLMLVMIMLVGRFGVLFLALTMVNTHKSKTFRYVQERVTIG